jgi:hypothetical protein
VLTLKFVEHFSGVSRTFWEEYVRPESMSVDTLGVYCKYARTHRMREHRCQDSTFKAILMKETSLCGNLNTISLNLKIKSAVAYSRSSTIDF